MPQWDSDFLWDIEWVDDDGAPLGQQHGLNREAAERQAQQWLRKTPGSQVSLYQDRGATSTLVHILTDDAPPRAGTTG